MALPSRGLWSYITANPLTVGVGGVGDVGVALHRAYPPGATVAPTQPKPKHTLTLSLSPSLSTPYMQVVSNPAPKNLDGLR